MPRIANKIVDALLELAEARHVYVRDQPRYELSAEQKKKILTRLARARKCIAEVEKLLLRKKAHKSNNNRRA